MNEQRQHPLNATETVSGRRIQPGGTLKRGDVYDSTTGKWEAVPEGLVGNVVEKGHGAILIRPAVGA